MLYLGSKTGQQMVELVFSSFLYQENLYGCLYPWLPIFVYLHKPHVSYFSRFLKPCIVIINCHRRQQCLIFSYRGDFPTNVSIYIQLNSCNSNSYNSKTHTIRTDSLVPSEFKYRIKTHIIRNSCNSNKILGPLKIRIT